jgi:hypothetical protein
MAQTNFTPISLYYSTTATNVPSAANLVAGELAINTQDGKLFYKDAAGVVQTIASKDVNSGTFTNISVSGVASFADGTVSLPSITNIGDTNTGIFFPAADTIAFTEGGAEAMRIDASGNVGIGTSSPLEKLDSRGAAVFSGDNATATNAFGTAQGLLLSTGSGVARVTAVSNGANDVNLALRSLSAGNAVTAITLNPNGAVALSGAVTTATGVGITFPASQSASSDANTLDDYEEGTFSPTIAGGFSTAPSSYATQRGAYRKIGSYVYFQIQIDATGTVADGSALQIGGLPFTCANASLVGHGGAFLNYGNSFDTNAGDTFHIINASTTIGVYTNAGSARAGNASGVNINNEFLLCGFYITA